ncbi:MAG: 6-bladed beta-propeller, partial [Candidatus Aminicenantes bacterium]|nr:6-bladed beta-propeller [Candidatus Aminicenantes bacterium]
MAIGRTDLLFSSIASVCEDDQLNFYVLDRLEHKVFKFSPQGRLLLTFGQKGQGPGDFQSPAGIVFTSKGELAVLEDLSYISLFKTDGTFIRRLDLNGRLGLGYIGPDRFYGWIWRPDDQQQVMVDGRNKILKTFHAVARDRFSTTLPDETGRL